MKEPQDTEIKTTTLPQKLKNIFCTKQFISTLSTGLICTFTSLGITSCIEDTNREINLRPLLEIGTSKNQYSSNSISIKNIGKGPAIITGGHIKYTQENKDIKSYEISDINNNLDEYIKDLLYKLNIKSESYSYSYSYPVYKELKDILGETDYACQAFIYSDYIPTIGSSIKDGEELDFIGLPKKYIYSKISNQYPDNSNLQKVYSECRDSFEKAMKKVAFTIKLEYKSLNGNKYDTNEKKIQFSF